MPDSEKPKAVSEQQIDFDLSPVRAALPSDANDTLACKTALQIGRDAVHNAFIHGASAAQLLLWQTEVTDLVFGHLWNQQTEKFTGMELIAVGGYGRAELHPHSDVDICILLEAAATEQQAMDLSAWVTSLWDLGLDIGHSVRTLEDCVREASDDVTVITNLMESRLLCGSGSLFKQMRAATAPEKMWPPGEFFDAKMQEQLDRHQKFHTNAYRLEPNVKESLGGLRDIQTISWVAQRQFGTSDLNDLVTHNILTQAEYDGLIESLELLWKIRYLLHHYSNKREDRLLFDHQRDIAHAFGYTEDEHNHSIELVMQLFYRSVMELQRLNDIILQGIGGVISGVTAATEPEPVNSRFQVRNGFLEVTRDDVFQEYPPALLEVFLLFGNTQSAENIRSNTVRLIRSHLELINDEFRADPIVRDLFLKIFSNPNKLTRNIRMMNRYGVMAAYIPAFDAIVGRMQYDLFHIYTVDEHTVYVIRNLRRFALPEYAHEFQFGSFVAQQLPRPELLYIAGLFHDIAKGRGGDHSILGAEDAALFCKQHELKPEETELIEWLVRYHLLMSTTAQRKDISDPAVQFEFASQVGSINKLNHLFLLTVADINATNPELWNSFKESLLLQLYQSTAQLLQRGLDNPVDSVDMIWQRQMHCFGLLKHTDFEKSQMENLWERLGEDYFKQYPATEIARHTEFILTNESTPGPLVSLRQSESRGSTEILIYTPDTPALFATITTVLDQLQLDVQSATINSTAENYALNTFYVLESDGELITEQTRKEQIKSALQTELNTPQDIPTLGATRPSRQLRHFRIPTTVEFDEGADYTEVHIVATDRPGILSSIGRVFLRANVIVQAARIGTLGERIEDVFFVTDINNQPLVNDDDRAKLAAMLIERL